MINIPTVLTILRIALIPVIVLIYYMPIPGHYYFAAIIFAVACLTDWLDGHLARLWQQTSKFGSFLDPVADKLVIAVALVLVLSDKFFPALAIPVMIIIGREIAISALREWMSIQGRQASLAVTMLAKTKTTVQMIALIMLLAYNPKTMPMAWGLLGYALLWLAASLTLCSMGFYLRIAWKELKTLP